MKKGKLIRVNGKRLWEHIELMGRIGEIESGGTSRFAWTKEYKTAVRQLIVWMEEAGLETSLDTVGNVYGKMSGTAEKPPVLTGSHLDTVPNGGRFDGIAGILCALEALQVIKEQGIRTYCPVEIVAFINEEASQFLGGCMGSKAVCGLICGDYADTCRDKNTGKSLRQAMQEFGMGLDPDRIEASRKMPEDYRAFLEVHVEQGTWLLENGFPAAVVDDIAGIRQFYLIFRGKAAHAGGMSMERRHDAFMAAANTACMLEKIVTEAGTGARGTVGYVEVSPNEHNIIPEKAVISVDFREADDKVWNDIYDRLIACAESQCAKRGVTYEIQETLSEKPCHCDPVICGVIEKTARKLGIPCTHMVSYPAHDAMQMGKQYPVGMIFLRSSNNGLSHCPEEYTSPKDLEAGANILLHTLLELAESST